MPAYLTLRLKACIAPTPFARFVVKKEIDARSPRHSSCFFVQRLILLFNISDRLLRILAWGRCSRFWRASLEEIGSFCCLR
jgi:hypothetical protein